MKLQLGLKQWGGEQKTNNNKNPHTKNICMVLCENHMILLTLCKQGAIEPTLELVKFSLCFQNASLAVNTIEASWLNQ